MTSNSMSSNNNQGNMTPNSTSPNSTSPNSTSPTQPPCGDETAGCVFTANGSQATRVCTPGAQGFECHDVDPTPGFYTRTVAAFDLNGDKLADSITGGDGGDLRVCLQRPDGAYDCQTVDAMVTGISVIVVTDIEGDGDPDIVHVGKDSFGACAFDTGSSDVTCRTFPALGEARGITLDPSLGGVNLVVSVFRSDDGSRYCTPDGAGGFACASIGDGNHNAVDAVAIPEQSTNMAGEPRADIIIADSDEGETQRLCTPTEAAWDVTTAELGGPDNWVTAMTLDNRSMTPALFASLGNGPSLRCEIEARATLNCTTIDATERNTTDIVGFDLEPGGSDQKAVAIAASTNGQRSSQSVVCFDAAQDNNWTCSALDDDTRDTWGVAAYPAQAYRGATISPAMCGDGACNGVESCVDCPLDCGACTNDCCDASATGGCADAGVATCVCAISPECCTDAWTEACVMLAQDQCGMSSCCTPQCSGKTCGDNGCGGVCGECLPDAMCDQGQGICESACAPGTQDDDMDPATACVDCVSGEYCAGGGAVAVACVAGEVDHDDDSTTPCQACVPGEFCAGAAAPAVACPAGQRDDDMDPATPCQACMPGQYCAGGVQAAVACAPGEADRDGSAATPCEVCGPGDYCPGGVGGVCEYGTYDDDSDFSTACVTCAATELCYGTRRLSMVHDVTASLDATCVVLADGEVRCWGRNTDGKLGDGAPHRA